MGLLVTLFLISSNVYGSLKAPQTRGFSYLEVWMVGVNGVNLLAIIEYGIVLAWKKYSVNATTVSNTNAKPKIPMQDSNSSWFYCNAMTKEEKIKMVDMVTFIFSIIFFIIFIVCYWTFCMNKID